MGLRFLGSDCRVPAKNKRRVREYKNDFMKMKLILFYEAVSHIERSVSNKISTLAAFRRLRFTRLVFQCQAGEISHDKCQASADRYIPGPGDVVFLPDGYVKVEGETDR